MATCRAPPPGSRTYLTSVTCATTLAHARYASPYFRHNSHPVLLEKPCPGTLTKRPASHNPVARVCTGYVTLGSSPPCTAELVQTSGESACTSGPPCTRRQAVHGAFRRLHPLTLRSLSTIPRSCHRTTGIKRIQSDQATPPSFLFTSRRLCSSSPHVTSSRIRGYMCGG